MNAITSTGMVNDVATSAASKLTDLRLKLYENGYQPVPVLGAHINKPGAGKAPKMPGWQTKCAVATEVDIKKWANARANDTNTGILCGTVVGVDIDVLDETLSAELVEVAVKAFGPTPLRRIGRAPKTLLVYQVETPHEKLSTADLIFGDTPEDKAHKAKVEILAKGQHFVADGIHPDTQAPYRWPEASPLEVLVADIPRVTRAQLEQFVKASESVLRKAGARTAREIKEGLKDSDKQKKEADAAAAKEIEKRERQGNAAAGLRTDEKPSREKIADALDHIVNDLDYDEWIRIGFALHDGLGAAGEDLWAKFSSGYKGNDPRIVARKYQSFATGRSVKVATLFWFAKQNGWWWDPKGANPRPQKDGDESDIDRLNKTHAVLPIGDKTRVVTFGELEEFPGLETIVMVQTLGDFQALQNRYRHVYTDAKGDVKKVPMGTHWVDSPARRQYDGGMEFMPQRDGDYGNKLNLWRGFGVTPTKPEPKSKAEAGCVKFLDFMRDIICSGNEADFAYLLRREATLFQKRIRSEIAIGLRTKEEGCGKGFYEKVMKKLLGTHCMQVTNPKHITGNFNPHLQTLLRLTADEALFVGNHEHRNALFGLVTESKLTIEPKGCGVFQVPNFLNLSLLSNSDHFLPVSDTARRFFVPIVSAARKQDTQYFGDLESDLEAGGYEALLHYFLREVDLDGFNVRQVPQSEGLIEQRDQSLDPLDAWWVELLETGILTGADPDYPSRAVGHAYDRKIEWQAISGTGATTHFRHVKQLGFLDQARIIEPKLKNFSDHKIGKHLTKMGCKRTRVLRQRGWEFPPLLRCRDAWVKQYPSFQWEDETITAWCPEEGEDFTSPDADPGRHADWSLGKPFPRDLAG
jgi:Primase C terminal 2 (PriCT-2)/Bifunctional DNA primase/polymerase, N-terminal/Family of unknown function (DUF5906)